MNKYTSDEVEKHNFVDDAWVIIDQNVYDITYFFILLQAEVSM